MRIFSFMSGNEQLGLLIEQQELLKTLKSVKEVRVMRKDVSGELRVFKPGDIEKEHQKIIKQWNNVSTDLLPDVLQVARSGEVQEINETNSRLKRLQTTLKKGETLKKGGDL